MINWPPEAYNSKIVRAKIPVRDQRRGMMSLMENRSCVCRNSPKVNIAIGHGAIPNIGPSGNGCPVLAPIIG
jgi:hypothetical protein